MTKPHRQRYGLGSIIKKAARGLKKVWKSPLGKAALIGGGLWGLNRFGMPGMGGAGKNWWSKGLGRLGIGSAAARPTGMPANLGDRGNVGQGLFSRLRGGIKDFGYGKAAFLAAGALGVAAPFLGGDEEEEIVDDWPGVDKIRQMAKDRHASLAFLPPEESVMSGYYGSNEGGIVGLANGGQPANAQAEQMLRMEYQKYRNQGGTMSYQQFKMAVLQQAQGQGPMAQGQQQAPQMAAYGGRIGYNRGRVVNPGGYGGEADYAAFLAQVKIYMGAGMSEEDAMEEAASEFWPGKKGGRAGYQGGELVEDASMVEETPAGMMEENVEEVQGEPTREQLEALAMEIFQLRLEELDEEQLMIVYQAAMEQQPKEEMMQEDIEFNPQMGGPQMGGPQMGGPAMAAEGGLMSLGGMEKDYRQEGGFVPLGGEEKADDVPARLSKNEFVFTADAVRAAGGGDIDQGAEVMENVMDNLESGGEISEESQGGGGEEMISEEEIAAGPDGAQDMYDQRQMLQSRIA